MLEGFQLQHAKYVVNGEIMGQIYLYFGTGGGKTTNALGIALRSIAHCKKVVIIQFMKWWKETGEYKIKDKLKPHYEIYQFGRPGWMSFQGEDKKMKVSNTDFQVRSINNSDKKIAKDGLEFAKKTMLEAKPHLLILDEICLATKVGLLPIIEVLDLLDQIPEETSIVLTGRFAPKELIDRADFVNEIIEVKSPDKFALTRGIQY